MKITLRAEGEADAVDVALERIDSDRPEIYTVAIGDRTAGAEIERLGCDSGWLRLHGAIQPFHVMRKGSAVHVWVKGRTYRFELVERTARRAAAGASAKLAGDLTAPMPGTILKIEIAPGEAFEAHQPLIIMESMKMEMTLSSPRPGRIKEIRCQRGQLVEMGALLAKLDPRDEAAE